MTFKHIKFEDSPVMRSLEKLAHSKGLVKDEPVVKTASATKNSKPTSNSLVENILYLCSQLRSSGLESEASELELNLMTYKQANTLYETSSEKGEDLVDRAHPKGSHKLEGVEGGDLALIETIVDQQMKNLKMVEKKPTGKLSNASDILKAVKIVLAVSKSDLESQLSSKISFIKNRLVQVYDNIKGELNFPYVFRGYGGLFSQLDDLNIEKAQEMFIGFYKRVKPSFSGGITEDTWKVWEPKLSAVGYALSEARELRNKIKKMDADGVTETGEEAPAEKAAPATAPAVKMENPQIEVFKRMILNIMNLLSGWQTEIKYKTKLNDGTPLTDADKNQANKWITNKWTTLRNIKNEFEALDPTNQEEEVWRFTKIMNNNLGGLNEFKATWEVS